MDQHKRALIRAITSARLAKSVGISTTHLSRIMSGKTSASESSAHELSSVANQMCESLELPAPFEPADFRPQLSLDYDSRELGPHEMFTVFDQSTFRTSTLTTTQLIALEDNDSEFIELLTAYYQGANYTHPLKWETLTIKVEEN
jgi:transcriptional regulator with XRE-family HTH domain